jgi:hypothetical protein
VNGSLRLISRYLILLEMYLTLYIMGRSMKPELSENGSFQSLEFEVKVEQTAGNQGNSNRKQFIATCPRIENTSCDE